MSKPKQHILFLYLSTGGGHIGAVKALMNSIASAYPDTEVETSLADGLPGGKGVRRQIIESGYTLVSTTFPFLWPPIYEFSRMSAFMRVQTDAMMRATTRNLARLIQERGATKIVNLHFLLNRPLAAALHRIGRTDIPTTTIITDPFTTHPLWTYRLESPSIVFSERARRDSRRRLIRQKLPADHVKIFNPILNQRFDERLPADEVRQLKISFGFDPDRPLILMAGGGEGLPNGETFLATLCAAKLDVQVAMVCGRNPTQYLLSRHIARLAGSLMEEHEKTPGKPGSTAVRVYGFVPFMYELMNMADAVVTKAGPATMFEVLKLRKPLILTSYLYGQERGNVDFVVRNRLGFLAPNPKSMIKILKRFLSDASLRTQVNQRISALHIGNGTAAITKYIVEEL